MSTVKIISFGRLKEILGPDFEIESENTDELLSQLTEKFPQLKDLKVRSAVNQKIISENKALQNNDVVALMPPYSGG
ncbi:molybdopterin synthase sulfur carrier subunit/molybdopterin molybdotransferase [Chryseobacterium taichungense]|uniref:Molybdopterin synthase sulfur carrier subunit/molybdopterin molybdotransferase n=1 Tax=Chryseobacterium taichungense TaxID=295069 RepID=A0A1H7X5E4_9FLAO|nr:MoaD/ThiS family protein [Chryseobacterium taichungense]SEM28427.1 molybdopterin synthase sulfur carrier subunit/molybdopterin molybdotransferase [Chryseobacterium taichungense]